MENEILECRKTDCGRFAAVFFNSKKDDFSFLGEKENKNRFQ
ncbi:hypothetical protein [Sinanaerobacter sp. ZZT-01]|nr:hypothetical protein [Sinanaerobacter sp. ZZT-01]WRR92085.1 hypothetical protein U5921_08355 [Sinanaerobacter sp. ZZT-01]